MSGAENIKSLLVNAATEELKDIIRKAADDIILSNEKTEILKLKDQLREKEHHINDLEDISQSKYDQIVDAVVNEYQKLDPITQEQIETLKATLQEKWNEVAEAQSKVTKKAQ
jgi:phage tail tape-measure protein